MTKPEIEARAGVDTSPALAMKSALTGFVGELTKFKSDIQTQIQKQEERLTMLDRKSAISGRPALATSAEAEVPHQKAFNAYLRTGDDDGLRGLALEEKALSTTVAADGGYLVDPQTADTIASVLQCISSC